MAVSLAFVIQTIYTTDEVGMRKLPDLRKTLSLTEGRHVERTVDLANDVFVTLDTGNIVTPRVWVFLNIHETGNLKIGFGATDILQLQPGMPAIAPSNLIAYAAGDGAASKLLYAVYA
jgi:hypothetical protein